MAFIDDIAGTLGSNFTFLKNFRFAVQIDGDITQNKFVGGFNRIQGIGDGVDIRNIKEGGYPGIHRFPRNSKFKPFKLIKGMSFSRTLWDWYHDVITWTKGKPSYRKTMSIYILDSVTLEEFGLPYEVWRFDFYNAFPTDWAGPELNSMTEKIAFESITIQHSGINQGKGLLSGEAGKVLELI